MKNLLIITAFMLSASGSYADSKTLRVSVTNPSKEARANVPVVVKVDDDVRSAQVKLGDETVIYQLDDLDDDGLYDELAFLADLGKRETKTYTVTLSTEGEPAHFDNRTYGYLGIRDRSEKNQKALDGLALSKPVSIENLLPCVCRPPSVSGLLRSSQPQDGYCRDRFLHYAGTA